MTHPNRVSTIQGWLPVAIWAAAILGGSSIPGSDLDGLGIQVNDKLVHAGEYFVLGFLALRRQKSHTEVGTWRAVLTSLALGLLLGAFDENYQRLIPLRDSALADWLADAIGTVLGVGVASWRYRLWSPTRSR